MLILIGAVWFLQGVGVLPGSFMSGRLEWAIYGAIAFSSGLALLVFAGRRRA